MGAVVRLPSTLLVEAVRTLDAQLTSPGMATVAVATLARGIVCRVPLPRRTGVVLLDALLRHPNATWAREAADAVAVLDDERVTDRVIGALRDPDADVEHVQVLLLVARGEPHAIAVPDMLIMRLAEQVLTRGLDPLAVASLIGSVARMRTIRPDLAHLIVDLWSSRPTRWRTIAAINVVAYARIPMGTDWIRSVLGAADEMVRCAAAGRVEELCDQRKAMFLLEQAVAQERLPWVRAEMLRALSDLVAADPDRASGKPSSFG